MVPESQPSFGTLASLCTRQQELNCPNILSYFYRWSSPTPPWKSLLSQTIILFFLKGPISGWAVSTKYLALSCFIFFPARARKALCRESNPLILKMKREAQQFRVSSKVTESSIAESCTWAPGSCSAVSSYTNPGSDTCKNTTETSANSLYL